MRENLPTRGEAEGIVSGEIGSSTAEEVVRLLAAAGVQFAPETTPEPEGIAYHFGIHPEISPNSAQSADIDVSRLPHGRYETVVDDGDSWAVWGEDDGDGTRHLAFYFATLLSDREFETLVGDANRVVDVGRLADYVAVTNAADWSDFYFQTGIDADPFTAASIYLGALHRHLGSVSAF